jgi:hypothetical protein
VLHEVSSDQARLLEMLFPHLGGLEFVRAEIGDMGVVLMVRTVSARWPGGSAGRRPHECMTGIGAD